MLFNKSKEDVNDFESTEKVGFKDLLAMMIAMFEIFMPVILAVIFGIYLLLVFVTKVWFK